MLRKLWVGLCLVTPLAGCMAAGPSASQPDIWWVDLPEAGRVNETFRVTFSILDERGHLDDRGVLHGSASVPEPRSVDAYPAVAPAAEGFAAPRMYGAEITPAALGAVFLRGFALVDGTLVLTPEARVPIEPGPPRDAAGGHEDDPGPGRSPDPHPSNAVKEVD